MGRTNVSLRPFVIFTFCCDVMNLIHWYVGFGGSERMSLCSFSSQKTNDIILCLDCLVEVGHCNILV